MEIIVQKYLKILNFEISENDFIFYFVLFKNTREML